MDNFDYVVIGSGPSSTGFFLSDKFQKSASKFCIIDTALKYRSIQKKEPSQEYLYKIHDINHKTYYGDSGATTSKVKYELNSNINITNSYFKGGLSNVWGAACKRYDEEELIKMGLSIEEKYFKKIEDYMNVNEMIFPKNSKMSSLYKKLNEKNSNKISVEPARLAVEFDKWNKECGGLYGCTSSEIFNSKDNFTNLTKDASLIEGEFVNKIFYVSPNNINIETISLDNGKKRLIKTKKLILGCGPINTAKLLLKSFSEISSIKIKDSQGFTLPLVDLSLNGLFNPKGKDIIELSNLFIKTKINKDLFHGQLYFSGTYVKNQITKQFKIPKFLLNNLLNICYLYQGYLPSEYSSEYEILFEDNYYNFKIIKNYDKSKLKILHNKTGEYFRKSKILQLNLFERISDVFGVYHFGSLSIFSDKKKLNISTEDGSIDEIEGIHIIDASLLKNLPSGPITSTIMANAMKICDRIF